MSRRDPIEAQLEALSALRRADPNEAIPQLKKALTRKTGLIAARAAEIAATRGFSILTSEVEAALETFLAAPTAKDRGCTTKIALARALHDLDSRADDLFHRAINHTQIEPAWPSPTDTAGALRGIALMSLIRLRDPDAMNLAARLLADPTHRAREGAAAALANASPLVAVPLLRHKILSGDPELSVLQEAMDSLLTLDPDPSVTFLANLLPNENEALSDAAAIALGDSRLEAAVAPLVDWTETLPRRRARVGLTALACNELLAAIQLWPPDRAIVAIEALVPYSYDDTLATAMRKAAATRPETAEACNRLLPTD